MPRAPPKAYGRRLEMQDGCKVRDGSWPCKNGLAYPWTRRDLGAWPGRRARISNDRHAAKLRTVKLVVLRKNITIVKRVSRTANTKHGLKRARSAPRMRGMVKAVGTARPRCGKAGKGRVFTSSSGEYGLDDPAAGTNRHGSSSPRGGRTCRTQSAHREPSCP